MFRNIYYKIDTWFDKYLGGHKNIGKLTIYGHNAMHWGITYYTKKWGYVCFRLPIPCYGWKPLYLYTSPNATPWAATFMLGKKSEPRDWALARVRKMRFGHNFNTDEHQEELYKINNK
jgi:hypothetical protein